MCSTRSRMSGSVLSSSVVEAPKWRTDRAERRAGKAGCLSKGLSVRDGSHLDVPKGFDQNGPSLRREVSKYRHISSSRSEKGRVGKGVGSKCKIRLSSYSLNKNRKYY